MLKKYDEMLCHQIVSTFDSVGTSAREWTERVWVSIHDTEGKYHFVTGFGVYPNRNVMDAYACFAVNGETQYNVRASRKLHPDTDLLKVGPFSYDIIDPMKVIRVAAEENEHNLSYEIDFIASFVPNEEETQFSQLNGRTIENVKRYVQVGRPKGWIRINGETIQVDPETWRCERDHSWGVRHGGGVKEVDVEPGPIPTGYMYNFLLTQFDDFGISYHIRADGEDNASHFCGAVYYPEGSKQEIIQVTGVDHNYTFRAGPRQVTGGEVTIHTEDGQSRTLTFKPLSVNYIVAGGYFGFRDFVHGKWMGEYFIDSQTIDLKNPEHIQVVSFLDDVMCEITCGDQVGYGIVEMVIVGTFPKYGIDDWHSGEF